MQQNYCYVGAWDNELLGPKCTPFTELIHPRDFQKYVDAITHSIWTNNPYMVDCFKPEKIMVFHQGNIRALTEHPEFTKWKDEFAPGEFWSIHGESWVSKQEKPVWCWEAPEKKK